MKFIGPLAKDADLCDRGRRCAEFIKKVYCCIFFSGDTAENASHAEGTGKSASTRQEPLGPWLLPACPQTQLLQGWFERRLQKGAPQLWSRCESLCQRSAARDVAKITVSRKWCSEAEDLRHCQPCCHSPRSASTVTMWVDQRNHSGPACAQLPATLPGEPPGASPRSDLPQRLSLPPCTTHPPKKPERSARHSNGGPQAVTTKSQRQRRDPVGAPLLFLVTRESMMDIMPSSWPLAYASD